MSADTAGEWTVTVAQLEAQIRWLQAQRFAFVTAADVISGAPDTLERDAVLITFDDAYVDTLALAQPVLARCGVRGVVFVPTAFVGQNSTWNADPRPIMTREQLLELARSGWELGLHSHRHANYRDLMPSEIEADLRANLETFQALALPQAPVFAYAYGGRPPRAPDRARMFAALDAAGIKAAFRIGNRINRWPIRREDRFEINRLGIRGDRDPKAFQRHVRWGRLLG